MEERGVTHPPNRYNQPLVCKEIDVRATAGPKGAEDPDRLSNAPDQDMSWLRNRVRGATRKPENLRSSSLPKAPSKTPAATSTYLSASVDSYIISNTILVKLKAQATLSSSPY